MSDKLLEFPSNDVDSWPSKRPDIELTYLTENQVRQRAQTRATRQSMTVDRALHVEARAEKSRYDVFLSQTIKDKEIVFGVYAILTEDLGLTVFCDWIDTPDAGHSNVTIENARYIRDRMQRSDTLLFVDTENADQSKWMCWELGWFDAAKGNKVGILPIVQNEGDPYRGREFLGLYPVVEKDPRHTLKVSTNAAQLRRIMQPGVIYGLATSFPFKAWAEAQNLDFMVR